MRTRCFSVQWKWDENQVFQCTVKVRWEPGVSVFSESEMRTRCFSVQWKWDKNQVFQCTVTTRWEPCVSMHSENKLFSVHCKDEMKIVIGGSCHNIMFVVTNVLMQQTHVLSQQKMWFVMTNVFVATKVLVVTKLLQQLFVMTKVTFCGDKHTFLWQIFFYDKYTFVVTKDMFWHNKHVFVATKVCLSWQNCHNNYLSWQMFCLLWWQTFFMTKLLSWQVYFCRDTRRVLLWQTRVCHDKTFVVIKMILVAAPADGRKPGVSMYSESKFRTRCFSVHWKTGEDQMF